MKKVLRSQLSARRLALSPRDWEERSLKICERIASSPEWKRWQKVALYRSVRNEVDLNPLLRLSPEKAYYFPKIDAEAKTMVFHKQSEQGRFQENSWGLQEPDGVGEILASDSTTLIIVPALAFDRKGHRLGYGKGFYDRYLSKRVIATFGVCFSEFLLDELPTEGHDIPVQNIITELEILSPAGSDST